MGMLGEKMTRWILSIVYGYIKKNPDVVKNELKNIVELEQPYKQWYEKLIDNVLWDVITYYIEKIIEGGEA